MAGLWRVATAIAECLLLAGGPTILGPLLALRAAVDLTPATPGIFGRAQWDVAAPGGGAHVVLTPSDADVPQLSADGRSALSGSTLFVFVTVQTGSGQLERLATVDLATPVAPTVRDLASGVAGVAAFAGRRAGGGPRDR